MAANFAAVNMSGGDKTGIPSDTKTQERQEGVGGVAQMKYREDNRVGVAETAQNGSTASETPLGPTRSEAAPPSPYVQKLLSRSSSSSLSETTTVSESPPIVLAGPHTKDSDPKTAEKRSLPARSITESTVDDAYVQFILYCNPSVPVATNANELQRAFRAIPRTEGKSFDIYALWLLVQKLYRGDLRSWTQLVQELGVAPPSKDDSPQKVAQYVSRLKRWMRCMHVDAFFSYCFGNDHEYYTHIPSPEDPNAVARDSVAPDDDLVLKALYPESRARRGRKPVFDLPAENDQSRKRTRLDSTGNFNPRSSAAQPNCQSGPSPLPISPKPSSQDRNAVPRQQQGPPSHFIKFRFDQPSPPVQYPHSAITPSYRGPDPYTSNEPRSAIVPMSQGNVSAGPQRPLLPLSPWPSPNPAQSSGNTKNGGGTNAGSTTNNLVDAPRWDRVDSAGTKPMLSLQVPQNPAGPVSMATPTVLVNGENITNPVRGQVETTRHLGPSYAKNSPFSSISIELVAQAVRERLQHSGPAGSQKPLTPNDAGSIANSMINHLETQCRTRLPPDVFAIYCALFLGVGSNVGLEGPPPIATTFEVNRDGPIDPSRGFPAATYTVKYQFSLAQNAATEALMQDLNQEGAVASEDQTYEKNESQTVDANEFEVDDPLVKPGLPGPDWKQRYLDLRRQVRKRDAALQQYKKRVLEAVISDPSLH